MLGRLISHHSPPRLTDKRPTDFFGSGSPELYEEGAQVVEMPTGPPAPGSIYTPEGVAKLQKFFKENPDFFDKLEASERGEELMRKTKFRRRRR